MKNIYKSKSLFKLTVWLISVGTVSASHSGLRTKCFSCFKPNQVDEHSDTFSPRNVQYPAQGELPPLSPAHSSEANISAGSTQAPDETEKIWQALGTLGDLLTIISPFLPDRTLSREHKTAFHPHIRELPKHVEFVPHTDFTYMVHNPGGGQSYYRPEHHIRIGEFNPELMRRITQEEQDAARAHPRAISSNIRMTSPTARLYLDFGVDKYSILDAFAKLVGLDYDGSPIHNDFEYQIRLKVVVHAIRAHTQPGKYSIPVDADLFNRLIHPIKARLGLTLPEISDVTLSHTFCQPLSLDFSLRYPLGPNETPNERWKKPHWYITLRLDRTGDNLSVTINFPPDALFPQED